MTTAYSPSFLSQVSVVTQHGTSATHRVASLQEPMFITVTTKQKAWHGRFPVSAGLQFRFRLCEYVDFFAEARASFYADTWNNSVHGNSIDANVAVLGGFNFNIGGRNFGTFNQCAYVSQIAALNGQVNDLRAQLLACGEEVAALQAQLPLSGTCPERLCERTS